MNNLIKTNQTNNFLKDKEKEFLKIIKEFNIKTDRQTIQSKLTDIKERIKEVLENGLDIGILTKQIIKITDIVQYNDEYYFYGINNKLYRIEL